MIPVFIGYDPRERAASNVLIDSLYQNSSLPLSITPLVTEQLEKKGIFYNWWCNLTSHLLHTPRIVYVYTPSGPAQG